jgi:hypothetical protein
MSARSISRVARTGFAAGALTVALSVPALAVPARDSSGVPVANASGNITAGTDVASPDQQAPIVASHNITAGTDVAASDQQNPIPAPSKPIVASAPTWPENPVSLAQPVNVSASPSGFQWDDAGIGAGGALVIALTALGGALIVRRRQTPDAPLAA